MKFKAQLLRLTGREYLPFAGWLLGWALLTAAIGHADTARLFAAYLFTRAARALTLMDCVSAVRRRWSAETSILHLCYRRAAVVEILSMVAELAVVAIIAAALMQIDQGTAAAMTLLLMLGLPPRHLLFLSRQKAAISRYKFGASWAGAGLAGLVLLGGGDMIVATLAMALREWIALGIPLWGRKIPSEGIAQVDALDWREVAAATGARARHRLTYRVGKGLLGTFLGPFSGFVARTSRGIGLHRRAERFVPKDPAPIALLAVGTAAAAILIQVALAKPATLIASASLLRISGVAGSVLLWLRFAGDHILDDEDDDED
ncbi:MAG: hypothetical protein R3E04_01460 [Sphingobium sp.]